MPTLRNLQTGATLDLEGNDALAALKSGAYEQVGAQSINVDTTGGPASMPLADVAGMGGNAHYQGVQGVTDAGQGEYDRYEALKGQRQEDLYGSQNIRAGLEGLASGVTLGASDVVLDALGADTKQRAQYNPNIRLAGELTGMVGAAIATGGVSAEAEGVAGGSRLAALLAKTPAGAISKATAKLGAGIGGIKGLVAANALEGAAYAAGQTTSQLLITDEPLSAEAMWSELGKNAAFGAGAGAAGGLLVGSLGKGWSKLKAAHSAATLTAPIVDVGSRQGKAVVKGIADALDQLDTAAEDLAAASAWPKALDLEPGAPGSVKPLETWPLPPAHAPGEDVATALTGDLQLNPAAGEAMGDVPGVPRRSQEAVDARKMDLFRWGREHGSAEPAAAPAATAAPIDDFATANAPALRDAGFDVATPAAASPAAAAAPAAPTGPATFDDLENLYNRMLKEHVAGVSEAKVDDMARLGVQNAAEFKALKSDVNRMRSTFRHARDAVKAGSPKAAERTANLRKSIDSLGSRLGVDIEGELATVRGGASAPAADVGYRPVEQTRADIRVDTDTFAVPEGTTQGQRDALSLYHGTHGYTEINKALRQQALTGEAIPAGEPHRIYKTTTPEQIAALDDLIAKSSTKRPVTVYRGLNEFPHDLTPGAVISEPAYTSTSTREIFAQNHARKTMLKLDVPAGASALYVPNVSKAAGEAEVLFPRGTKFRVKNVEPGDGHQIVHAEILPPDGANQGATSVGQRMDDAFGRLDTAGDNYVFIGDLRKALPDVPREQFDAALNDLRKAKHFTVDSLQNQHVDPSAKYGADWKEQLMPQGQSAPVGLVARRGGPLAETAAKVTKPALRVGPKPDLDEFGGEMQRLKPRPADGFAMPAELSGPETRAIRWYGDNNYSPYKGIHSAEDLNALLRSGDDAHPAVRELTAHLDSVLAKSATTKPTTVYRGIVADPAEYTAGAVLDQPAYLSASTDVAKADEFIAEAGRRGGSKIRMSIDVPAGTPAVNMPSIMPDLSKRGFDEAEVLLGRGQKLRVLSSEAGPDGVINVRATVGDAAPEVAAAPAAASTVTPAAVAPAAAPEAGTPYGPAGRAVGELPAVGDPESLAGLRKAQRAAYSALGVTKGRITADHVAALLKAPAAESLPKLAALDEYLAQAKALAKTAGQDISVSRLDDAAKALSEAASEATGGVTMDASTKALIAAAVGGEGLDAVGVDNPVGDLAMVALAAKVGGGKLAGKVGGKAGFLGRVVKGTGRLFAGRQAAKLMPGAAGLGLARIGAYEAGANAFSGLFNSVVGQRAIAGVTHNAVTRVAGALERLSRPAAGAIHAGQLSGTALIRDARFGYGEQASKPKRSTTRAAFKDRSEELAACAANPMACHAAVNAELAEVRKVAPYVADELEMLAVNVNAYLYSKMPRDPGTMTRLGQSTWQAPDYDIRAWGEHVRGALAPVETLEAAMSGRITPQAAEAVRTLFPQLFSQAQRTLAERAPELRKSLTPQAGTRLSVLFDTPLDSTMRPDFRGFIAEQHATRAQQSAQQAAQAKPGAPSANPAPMTGAQLLLH